MQFEKAAASIKYSWKNNCCRPQVKGSVLDLMLLIGPLLLGKTRSYEITTVNQSVSQSVKNHFFIKTAHRIFIIYHLNLWCLKGEKVTQLLLFFRKNIILGKCPNILIIFLLLLLFWVCKEFSPLMCTFLALHYAP